MNVRAFDLMIRSLTTALLALIVLLIAGYEIIHAGSLDAAWGSFVGLVLGVYFGAHVSQNASGQRARRDQVITAEAKGEDPQRDSSAILRDKTTPSA